MEGENNIQAADEWANARPPAFKHDGMNYAASYISDRISDAIDGLFNHLENKKNNNCDYFIMDTMEVKSTSILHWIISNYF